MQKVHIQKIPSIETEKGTTIEWCKGIPGQQVSIFYRKKDQKFAYHFHKGDDPSKNPERFLLVTGKVRMKFVDARNNETLEQEISPGMEVVIEPYVYHEVIALEDAIFLEYRSTVFDPQKSDTYPGEEYQAALNESSDG